jgi:hypothetical protein
MSISARRLQRTKHATPNHLQPNVLQDFTIATWGQNAAASTSVDGGWRRNGDWPGTGGNLLQLSNSPIDTSTGILCLICRANSTNAGEVQSLRQFGHGYFECRMKVGQVAGTCQSFFLIAAPSYGPGEIDFEFLTGGSNGTWLHTNTGEVMVNMHPPGTAVRVSIPFNPCTAFHTYGILWTPARLAFVTDGTICHEWTSLPAELGPNAAKMYVTANNWTSQADVWGGGPPTQDTIAQYDYFKVWEGSTTIP